MNERKSKHNKKYESSLSLRIISFLIPLVGLIVYASNIVNSPIIAKECGKFALYGFILGIILIASLSLLFNIYNPVSNNNGLLSSSVTTEEDKKETEKVKEYEQKLDQYFKENF